MSEKEIAQMSKVQAVPRRKGSKASAGSRQDAEEGPDDQCEPPKDEVLIAAQAAAAADKEIIEDFTAMSRPTCLHPQLGDTPSESSPQSVVLAGQASQLATRRRVARSQSRIRDADGTDGAL